MVAGQPLIFASLKIFLFVVRRNSASFASRGARKSFAARQFVNRGGAKLPEFRLGGVTKTPRGAAKLVNRERSAYDGECFRTAQSATRVLETLGRGEGAQNSWGWVLRIFAIRTDARNARISAHR